MDDAVTNGRLETKIIRSALTKLIWWYETRRPYLIRKKALLLPSVHVTPDSKSILAVLTTPSTSRDAMWAAYSFLQHLPPHVGLHLIVDGDLRSKDFVGFNRLFPGLTITKTTSMIEQIKADAPRVTQLSATNALGRKLSSILALQRNYDVLYIDTDVLCLGSIPELCAAIEHGHYGLYLQDINILNADSVLLKRAKVPDWRTPDHLTPVFYSYHAIPCGLMLLNICWGLATTLLHGL